MLNRPINLRQAEEPAAPPQAETRRFAKPQDEIRHLQAHDRTLGGFARVLEIVDRGGFFCVNQDAGRLDEHWLAGHRTQCGACVGALAAWFFGGPAARLDGGNYHFVTGRQLLAEHLGMTVCELAARINAARNKVASSGIGYVPRARNPFGADQWSVDYAAVFRELAREFPGK